jgi:hypothetical protein
VDYTVVLLNPIYHGLGVPALLTPRGAAEAVRVTVIDKTATIEVSEAFDVHTVRPAATVRMRQLIELGVAASQLDGGTLEFNERVWTIDSHQTKPSPDGVSSGELLLWLEGS